MKLNGRPVQLDALTSELQAAGISVSALGTVGDELITYDVDGGPVDLPADAASVVAAHTPPELPDLEAELAQAIQGATTLEQLKGALMGRVVAKAAG